MQSFPLLFLDLRQGLPVNSADSSFKRYGVRGYRSISCLSFPLHPITHLLAIKLIFLICFSSERRRGLPWK